MDECWYVISSPFESSWSHHHCFSSPKEKVLRKVDYIHIFLNEQKFSSRKGLFCIIQNWMNVKISQYTMTCWNSSSSSKQSSHHRRACETFLYVSHVQSCDVTDIPGFPLPCIWRIDKYHNLYQIPYITNQFKNGGAFSCIILHFQIQGRMSGLSPWFSIYSLLLRNGV